MCFYGYTDRLKLKDDYTHFYHQLLAYISSLPERWFFLDCFDRDGNGSFFVVTLHDGAYHQKVITAHKNAADYIFNG